MKRLIVAIIVLASACCAEDDPRDRFIILFVGYGPLNLSQLAETSLQPARLKKLANYSKVTLADALVEKLSDKSPVPLRNYTRMTKTYDRTIWAGRAVAALEEMLGTKLAKVTPDTTANQLDEIQAEARKQVGEYRAKMAQAAELNSPLVDALKKKYTGKIKTYQMMASEKNEFLNIDDGKKSFQSLTELLAEWYPLGKKLSELEEIVGVSTRKCKTIQAFDFPNGADGLGIGFIVKDGIITGVILLRGID